MVFSQHFFFVSFFADWIETKKKRWEIDLGELYHIEMITITNVTDKQLSQNLSHFWVLVSETPFNVSSISGALSVAVWSTRQIKSTKASEFRLTEKMIIGRYIRIQLEVSSSLALAVFSVYGARYIPKPPTDDERDREERLAKEQRKIRQLEAQLQSFFPVIAYIYAVFSWQRPKDFAIWSILCLGILGWLLWMDLTVLTVASTLLIVVVLIWWLTDVLQVSGLSEKLESIQSPECTEERIYGLLGWTIVRIDTKIQQILHFRKTSPSQVRKDKKII